MRHGAKTDLARGNHEVPRASSLQGQTPTYERLQNVLADLEDERFSGTGDNHAVRRGSEGAQIHRGLHPTRRGPRPLHHQGRERPLRRRARTGLPAHLQRAQPQITGAFAIPKLAAA